MSTLTRYHNHCTCRTSTEEGSELFTRVLRRVLDRWYTAQSPTLPAPNALQNTLYGAAKGTYRHVRHVVNHVTASKLLLKHFRYFPGTGGVDRDRMTRHSKPKTSITLGLRKTSWDMQKPHWAMLPLFMGIQCPYTLLITCKPVVHTRLCMAFNFLKQLPQPQV